MRRRLYGLMCVVIASAGCSHGPFARNDGIPVAKPTAGQLITHLNNTAKHVQSIESQNVSIDAKQGLQQVSLSGLMAYQKPRGFRLMAGAVGIGGTDADIGSNDQEIWFWIKRSEEPYLYYCAYKDLPDCKASLPIQPDWIAEALGLTEFGPPENYQLKTTDKTHELICKATSPQGQPLQKITVVDARTGRIVAHHLRNMKGQDIWLAKITEHQDVGGYILPRRVQIICPKDNDKPGAELTLKLDRLEVNRIAATRTKDLFARPVMPGVKTYDLARGPNATPTSIQRVGGPR